MGFLSLYDIDDYVHDYDEHVECPEQGLRDLLERSKLCVARV